MRRTAMIIGVLFCIGNLATLVGNAISDRANSIWPLAHRTPVVSRLQAALALSQQFWSARLAALAYLVATPLLNVVLYRPQLVARFISTWGFVALVLLATGLGSRCWRSRRGFEPGQLLVIPIILLKVLFATWLIVQGFRPSPALAAHEILHETPAMIAASI